MIIKSPKELSEALLKRARLQAKQIALGVRINSLNASILAYYKHNKLPSFKDAEGNIWRKMQGSTTIYDDKNFKSLLKNKGIAITTVYHTKTIEERDEEAIMRLLKEKKISVEEWKQVATIKYFSPYLRKQPNKGGSDNPDTSS